MTNNPTSRPEPGQGDDLFIRFANTLTYTRGRASDSIPDADALLGWLHTAGLISDRARAAESGLLRRDPTEAGRRLERFWTLRRVLHEIAAEVDADRRPSPDRLRELNHILRHGLHYHQLRLQPDGTRYAFSQVGDRLDQARASIAASLAQFLADDAPGRLRVCANSGCRELFIDHSAAGRRIWCDMRTCGNQAKAARHRARAREAPARVPVRSESV
jgi:predicted RNA-binding Zn ribbon-like protein